MNARIVVPVVVASMLAASACSSKKPPQPMTPTASVDAGTDDAAAPTDGGGSAEGGLALADAGVALPQGGEAAADMAIDTAVQALAAKHAPGMAPEGTPGRATLAPNAHFNMLVTLQPNRCYAIVGYSPEGGVQQLDLKLFAPPLYTVESGKAVNEKNQPVMGKGKNAVCPVLPFAVPYKLDAAATKGTGRIAVWVYSRAK